MTSEPDRMPPDLFAKPPEKIVEILTSRDMFPRGAASGMRVLSFYMAQAGKGLAPSRRRNLEKAKKMLSACVEREMAEAQARWNRKVA